MSLGLGNSIAAVSQRSATFDSGGGGVAPNLVSTELTDASTLTLTFDKEVTTPNINGFSLKQNGSAAGTFSITNPSTSTLSLVFTVNVSEGDTLLVSYDQATGACVAVDDGTELTAFTDTSITNNVLDKPTVINGYVDADGVSLYLELSHQCTASGIGGFSVWDSNNGSQSVDVDCSETTTPFIVLGIGVSAGATVQVSYNSGLNSIARDDQPTEVLQTFSNFEIGNFSEQ